jgi:hypothetical protein
MFVFKTGHAVGKLKDRIGRILHFAKTLCLNAWHNSQLVQFRSQMLARVLNFYFFCGGRTEGTGSVGWGSFMMTR